MASPRIAQAGTPQSARALGKVSRTKPISSEESKRRSDITPAKDQTTSKQTKYSARTQHKDPTPRSQQPADPYSLSDLDDNNSMSTRPSAQAQRKRKRSFASSEQPAANRRLSQAKPGSSAQLDTRGSKGQSAKILVAASRRRASSPDYPETPEQIRSRSSTQTTKRATPPRKQPRLIDALAAQKDDDSNSDSHNETTPPPRGTRERTRDLDDEIRSILLPSMNPSTEGRSPAKTYTPRTTDMATKSTKVKYTYSQASRSMASTSRDTGHVGTIAEEPESDPVLSSPIDPGPGAFDVSETSDAEEDTRLAIKSVHELRRAGANNRFSDELEDLISRIGKPASKPSTLRRNALLELSQKLQRKDFASQFRDHSDRDSIAESIGNEEDIISGFALSAALVQFLSDRPAPHLLHKLAAEGIGVLLGRLLPISEDIDGIASRKQTNLSKQSRLTLSDLKCRLLGMDLYAEHTVTTLSPRTLALILLDILYQSSSLDESSMISSACLDDVSQAASELMRESAGLSHSDLEFSLVVSILEAQSNVARETDQEVAWLRRQSSNARQSLQRILREWVYVRPKTRLATLKMAINVTNTGDGASAFNDASLLTDISHCISIEIRSAVQAVERQRLDNLAYEGLLLVLGVMINIMEHCLVARGSVNSSSIEELATLYSDNRLAMSEADSEEKSKLSVAFGYLAVLLGYLSLSQPGLTVVKSLQNGQGVRKLLGSIRDFIDVYKNVESKIHGLEGLVSELQTQLV